MTDLPEADRELLDQAEYLLHSLSVRLLGVSHLLQQPFTDRPDLSPWSLHIGKLAHRAHDLAMAIRKRLGLPHRWASNGLGTEPLEVEHVIAAAVAAEREREAHLDHCPGCAHRYGTCGCACCAHVARAVAAERQEIIRLASRLRAVIPADHPEGAMASFADYLRVTSAEGSGDE